MLCLSDKVRISKYEGTDWQTKKSEMFRAAIFFSQIVLLLKCWQILKAYRGMLHFWDITIAQGAVKTQTIITSGLHRVGSVRFFFVLYESTSAHTNRECTSLIRTWLHSFFFALGSGWMAARPAPQRQDILQDLMDEKSETLLRQIHYLTPYSRSQCY